MVHPRRNKHKDEAGKESAKMQIRVQRWTETIRLLASERVCYRDRTGDGSEERRRWKLRDIMALWCVGIDE